LSLLFSSNCSVAEHYVGPVHHVVLMLVECATVMVTASPLHASSIIHLSHFSTRQSGSNFQLVTRSTRLVEILICSLQKASIILEVGGCLLRVASLGVTLHHLVLHGR